MINEIDQMIDRSLRRLAEDTQVRRWRARERNWVNYFAPRHLISECSPDGPLKDCAQIGIEVGVPQPPFYKKLAVGRDLVIWANVGDTCWTQTDEATASVFNERWPPSTHPLAILEWKVWRPNHPKGSKKSRNHEREWLKNYCRWQPSVLGYAIEIDGTVSPATLTCTRFLGSTESQVWLKLTMEWGT
jgi:hypothetical protein